MRWNGGGEDFFLPFPFFFSFCFPFELTALYCRRMLFPPFRVNNNLVLPNIIMCQFRHVFGNVSILSQP